MLYRGVCLKQLFSSNPILIPPKNHSKLHQRLLPMAHNLIASLPICNSTRVLVPSKDLISLVPSRSGIPRPIQCMLTSEISDSPKIFRRSANYQPSIWHYDYIQSLFFYFLFFKYDRNSNLITHTYILKILGIEPTPSYMRIFWGGNYYWAKYPSGDYIQSPRNEYVVYFVIVFHLSVLSMLVTITKTYYTLLMIKL